jgi:hypothetical protein
VCATLCPYSQVVVDVTNPWKQDYVKLGAEHSLSGPDDVVCDVEGNKDQAVGHPQGWSKKGRSHLHCRQANDA